MDVIRWDDAYSVGVPAMDAQHRALIDEINRLTTAGSKTATITAALAALDRYVKEHFRAEEELMRACGFPHLEQHMLEHRVFEEWLLAIKLTFGFSTSNDAFAATVNTFLRNWLLNHILRSDMAYKAVLGEQRAANRVA